MTRYYTWGSVSWGSPALLVQGDALSPEIAEQCYPLLCKDREVLIGLPYGEDTVFYRYFSDRFSEAPRALVALIRENLTTTHALYNPTTGYRKLEPQENEQTCRSIYKTQNNACDTCIGDKVATCALATHPLLFHEKGATLQAYGSTHILPEHYPAQLGCFEKVSPKLCTETPGIQAETNIYRLDFEHIDTNRAELSRRSKNAAKTRKENRQTCPTCSHQDRCQGKSYVYYCNGPYPEEKEIVQNILTHLPDHLKNFSFDKDMRTLLANAGPLDKRYLGYKATLSFNSDPHGPPKYVIKYPRATEQDALSYQDARALFDSHRSPGEYQAAPPPLSDLEKALFFEVRTQELSAPISWHGHARARILWIEHIPGRGFRLHLDHRRYYEQTRDFYTLSQVYEEWGHYTYFKQATRPTPGRT